MILCSFSTGKKSEYGDKNVVSTRDKEMNNLPRQAKVCKNCNSYFSTRLLDQTLPLFLDKDFPEGSMQDYGAVMKYQAALW